MLLLHTSDCLFQVCDPSAHVDSPELDHDGGSDGEHHHVPGPGHVLPHGHRDGPLVDHLLLRPRPLHLPDAGRHRRETGTEDEDEQSAGRVVRPRV